MDSLTLYVCFFGIFCAFFAVFLNANLVSRIVLKKSKRVDEMMIFYYRFVLDVFFGFFLAIWTIFIVFSIYFSQSMNPYRPFIVYLALPWSNISACRTIIALSIAMERVIAAYFPLKYRSYRANFPNLIILSIGALAGLFEIPMLFGFCSYRMEIPPTCRIFGCAMNQCFRSYWTGFRALGFAGILSLSVLLSVKLFVLNSQETRKKLSRANRLALLDTVTVLIFDFLPSLCGNLWPNFPLFNFEYVGPYNATLKVIGCAIEAAVVSTVLLRRTTVAEKSSSQKSTAIKNSEARSQVFHSRSQK